MNVAMAVQQGDCAATSLQRSCLECLALYNQRYRAGLGLRLGLRLLFWDCACSWDRAPDCACVPKKQKPTTGLQKLHESSMHGMRAASRNIHIDLRGCIVHCVHVNSVKFKDLHILNAITSWAAVILLMFRFRSDTCYTVTAEL